MATPGSERGLGGAGQQTPRSTVSRRSRPQSLFYRDLAATPVPGVRAGKLGTSPSWKDHSGGIDHLPPPPCATLDGRVDGFGDSSVSAGSDVLDLAGRGGGGGSFSSPFGGSGPSFSKSTGFSAQSPLSRSIPRQDSSTRKGFGSPYSDAGSPGFPAYSPLQSQKLQFQTPDSSKGKEPAGQLVEVPQALTGPVSFVRPDATAREAAEGEEWVTVYGFGFSELHLVFREFEKCGPVMNYLPGPPGSNYVHLQFQSRHDARKALQKNGVQLSSSVLVGVKPVDKLHLPSLRELTQGAVPVSPPNTPRKDVLTASVSRPYYLNGAESQGPQPLRPLASPMRSAVSRLVDLVFGV